MRIAQLPVPDPVWNKAAESGFLAILILVLLAIIIYMHRSHTKEIKEVRNAMNRVARSNTLSLLAQAWLPKPFKEQASQIAGEIDSMEKLQDSE